jgi:hypothetical protein
MTASLACLLLHAAPQIREHLFMTQKWLSPLLMHCGMQTAQMDLQNNKFVLPCKYFSLPKLLAQPE